MRAQPLEIITAVVFMLGSTNANAAPVSVTGEFTKFTMGGFYSAAHTYDAKLLVNGQHIDICGGDPLCAAAIDNPSSISVNLSGNTVDFGYDNGFRQNAFSFTGDSSQVSGTGSDNQFTLGKFSFTNGGFYPLAFLDFTLTTHSKDFALDNHTFNGRIRLDTNSTGAFSRSTDAQKMQEADYFIVQDASGNTLTELGSVRVFDYNICLSADPSAPDCNIGSADLKGYINSLHLSGFENATGGAFLNSSTTSDLGAPVPLPPAAALFAFGIFGLWGNKKNSRRKIAINEL